MHLLQVKVKIYSRTVGLDSVLVLLSRFQNRKANLYLMSSDTKGGLLYYFMY